MIILTQLNNVKQLLDIETDDTSKDGLINLYIKRAEDYTKNYLKIDDIPAALTSVIEDIAVFRYRQKGVENIKAEGKGSLSETYMESIPLDLMNQINAFRRIRVL